MAASRKIKEMMESSSWIRRMFEAGNALRAIHGRENVFDFSLGNPDAEPPAEFRTALREILDETISRKHGYMPNAGYPEARAAVAEFISGEQGVRLGGKDVVMSCGAGAG
jgi:aspartate aminotransferase